MSSVNKHTIVGNLGQDPEVRYLNDGGAKLTMSVATSESWKDKHTGERREKTEWHRVVTFNQGLVDIAERFLQKGSKVYIEGTPRTRKWTDNDGIDRYFTEVVLEPFSGVLTMLDSRQVSDERRRRNRSENQSDNNAQAGHEDGESMNAPNGGGPTSGNPAFGGGAGADLDDEIPF